MAIFTIYRYKFRPPSQLNIFSNEGKDGTQAKYNSPADLFESFFGKAKQTIPGIAACKETRHGDSTSSEWETHGNEIEGHANHIAVLKLQENKTKKILTQDWKTKKEGHYPDCRVIIDFRPESQLMVIERKSSTFTNPDKAKKLLEESFNRMMQSYGVSIMLEPLSKKQEFWDAVNDIRRKFNDTVTRVQFDFNATQQVDDDGSFTFQLLRWASMFTDGSSLIMNVGNDERLKVVERDLTRMSELCCRNRNYNLTVRFSDFGLYRYGQDVKAQFGLDDSVIDEFVGSDSQLVCFDSDKRHDEGLTNWFNRVNILFSDYGKESTLVRKRNTQRRV